MNKEVIWESLKEPLREIALAALPGLLVYFQTVNTQWGLVFYLVLRSIDSYLHEKAMATPIEKRTEGILGTTGLTGF